METKLNIKRIDKRLAMFGWNRSDFARALGISRQLLSYYLLNPSLKSIEKIAFMLDFKVKDLI